MIICVSIIDKHRPVGQMHVGTYHFEIDYPGDSHFDFLTIACPVNKEAVLRPYVGKLLTKEEIPNPIRGDGSPV